MLTSPKVKTQDMDKCGVIYEITCSDFGDTYVGRQLKTRNKEHASQIRRPSAVAEHCETKFLYISEDSVKVLTREDQNTKQTIMGAIKIKQRAPPMNRDMGYDLP
jgi:hypothetical protein